MGPALFPGQRSCEAIKPGLLDFIEAIDDGVQSFAPCSRQITTPASHYSIFYRPDAVNAQPTVSIH